MISIFVYAENKIACEGFQELVCEQIDTRADINPVKHILPRYHGW